MEVKKGFTLVELIVVLAIIAALVGILIAVIKPQQIFARLRDTQRSADLNNLSRAIDIYLAAFASNPNDIQLSRPSGVTTCIGGTASATIYYSVATSGTINLSSPAGGTFTVASGSTSTAVDGTGWLPVNLATASEVALSQLPLDPRNQYDQKYYYTYACKSDYSYELNANMEVLTANEQNDGGDNPNLFEVGNNVRILPTTTAPGFYQ